MTGLELLQAVRRLGVEITRREPRREQRRSGEVGDDAIWTDYILTYRGERKVVPTQVQADATSLNTYILEKARELVHLVDSEIGHDPARGEGGEAAPIVG